MFSGYQNRKGLKDILENKKILKLIHDCRNDWDSLLYQFSIRLYNFIDTQEAFFIYMIFYYQEITLPISLMNFIENILNIKLKHKEKFKNDININPNLWEKRPIDKVNLEYAAEDVLYLIKAWDELQEKFNLNMKEIVKISLSFYFFSNYFVVIFYFYQILS
jgi:ribonuclease D